MPTFVSPTYGSKILPFLRKRKKESQNVDQQIKSILEQKRRPLKLLDIDMDM